MIVPKAHFNLLSGEELLTTYQFGSHVARHTFCSQCGIKAFYTPRSNPDGVDVNIHCLDVLPEQISITDFDGQNWEKHAHKLAHKSKI